MSDSFEQILNPSQQEEHQEEHQEQEEQHEEQQEQQQEQSGEEHQQQAAAPSPGADEVEKLRKEAAAFKAEADRQRRRAQELEAAKQQQPAPDFWEQPETVIDQRVQAVEQRLTNRFLNMSEAAARARHEDYDDKLNVFAEMVQENPALYDAMLNDADPGEFAYKAASRTVAMKEMGDPESYRAKIEAEVRAKIEAEYAAKAKADAEAAIAAKLKPGFSEQRSTQPRDTSGKFTGHRPMTEILGSSKRI